MKTLYTILVALCLTTLAHAYPCGGWGGGYARPYCGGGGGGGGYCGGRTWVSYNYGNGGGCYAPVMYGNPYAGGYYGGGYVPVNVGPPTGIGITLFGLNILGINPTIPQAVPAQ